MGPQRDPAKPTREHPPTVRSHPDPTVRIARGAYKYGGRRSERGASSDCDLLLGVVFAKFPLSIVFSLFEVRRKREGRRKGVSRFEFSRVLELLRSPDPGFVSDFGTISLILLRSLQFD